MTIIAAITGGITGLQEYVTREKVYVTTDVMACAANIFAFVNLEASLVTPTIFGVLGPINTYIASTWTLPDSWKEFQKRALENVKAAPGQEKTLLFSKLDVAKQVLYLLMGCGQTLRGGLFAYSFVKEVSPETWKHVEGSFGAICFLRSSIIFADAVLKYDEIQKGKTADFVNNSLPFNVDIKGSTPEEVDKEIYSEKLKQQIFLFIGATFLIGSVLMIVGSVPLDEKTTEDLNLAVSFSFLCASMGYAVNDSTPLFNGLRNLLYREVEQVTEDFV